MIGALQLVESKTCADAHRQAVEGVLHRLKHNCTEKRQILLMISGGTNLSVAVQALSQLTEEELSHITVAQVDEKYLPVGDPDSTWQQFIQTFGGIESLAGTLPILHEGNSFSEAVNNYDLELTTLIHESDYSLAMVGMMPDGGIGGMKPMSADKFQLFFNDDFVAGYKADDYERITMTDYGLKVVHDIVVYACGPEKQEALEKMKQHIPVHNHPAQLLKVYDRVTLYTSNTKK